MSQDSVIKQALKQKKIVFGWNSVERLIKNGSAKIVFLSSTVADSVKIDVRHYASKIGGFEVELYNGDAYQLGVLCKKPFPISVLGIRNG